MGKFSGASAVNAAQQGTLGQIELPINKPDEEQAAPPSGIKARLAAAADPSVNLKQAEELPAAPEVLDSEQQLQADLQEQQRQAVPSLRDRWADIPTPKPLEQATASSMSDGGIINRAKNLAQTVEAGGLKLPTSTFNTSAYGLAQEGATGAQIAEQLSPGGDVGSIQAAVNRVGAMDNTDPRNARVDPDFLVAGSMVTENLLAQFAQGGTETEIKAELDPLSEAQGGILAEPTFDDRPNKVISKQQGNAQIGQQIAQEYQRLKGREVPDKIPPKEAEALGDLFKMTWATQNPNLVNVVNDKDTKQTYLQLTPEGEDVIAKGVTDRKRLFPSKDVRPAKTPLKQGQLPGDTGQNVVKGVQGKVGADQKFGKTLKDAMRNLANVPNVVDVQRMKILYATALPILQNLQNPEAFSQWQAGINNIGADKLAKYEAKHGPAVAQDEMIKAAQKLANEIQAIARERKGANYLSYAIQGFQGRISPQQSVFNPTSSKAVRFVTRNAVPAPAKPGSRVEKNLRQMYAMMLVKGADGLLPDAREHKLRANEAKLEAWGDMLANALQMTDAEAESISQAIEQGLSLTDPNFPQVKPLQVNDPELEAAIASKGEDGPHFIDGLMDFANYVKKKKAGQPHYSYFNAYIDGKTNGIASNGIQMGISKTAQQTGVIRDSETDYLDESGDVRDVLKNTLLSMVDTNGFDGNNSEIASELSAVARAVFSHRDLNKKTTMTFGYGKEIPTFGQDMYDTAMYLKADPGAIKDPAMREAFTNSIDVVEEFLGDEKKFGDSLMTVYGPALASVMSPEALASRNVMRSAAVLYSATNQIMQIQGPTGMDLRFGRDANTGETTESRYKIRGDDFEYQSKVQHQEKAPTSAAVRKYEDSDDVGGYAYGGSVVGPVQALDAATVGLTASGKSWNRMKSASGGNPYMHTIYDAFKVDAMGYDVLLEEVNENWLDTSMNWSYLEETQKSVDRDMKAWREKHAKADPNAEVEANDKVYLDWIMKQEMTDHGPKMSNFNKRIGTAGAFSRRDSKFKSTKDAALFLQNEMAKVGYDWKKPPEKVTHRQLHTFVNALEHMLQTGNRLGKAVQRTNNNKKALKQEILSKGYKTPSGKRIALQYYAH